MDTFGFAYAGHAVEADLALRLEHIQALLDLSQDVGDRDCPDCNIGLGADTVVELDQVNLLPAQPLQADLHRPDDSRLEVVGVGLAQAVLSADEDLGGQLLQHPA